MSEVLVPSASIAVAGSRRETVPTATILDTITIFADVLLPTIAKGVIMRRPLVLGMAERLDLDRRAVARMEGVRNKYGSGPLMLRFPGRRLALLLDPRHVHRALGETPAPFATETKEKRAALAHFEPKNVLISHGQDRAERRRWNESVLDSHRPAHRESGVFLDKVNQEADTMMSRARTHGGRLTWAEFSETWFRLVRRITFGDAASDDNRLSIMMAKLRSAANWAFLAPRRTATRNALLARIRGYLERAEPGSLAGVMAAAGADARTAPEHQVPQWLFAFDPAGMATFRALALLASHPDYARRVREEMTAAHTADANAVLPLTRAAVLESLRLWPTTPLILRETAEQTVWAEGVLPRGTGVIIYTPFFHRDRQRLPFADRFAPEIWTTAASARDGWPLIPFSEGPAVCPGQNLVLLLSSAMLTAILDRVRVRLRDAGRLERERLPGTLSHFGLQFDVEPRR